MRDHLEKELPRYAAFLRKMREASGLTQCQLAEEIGVTPSFISQVESGKKSPGEILAMSYCSTLKADHRTLVQLMNGQALGTHLKPDSSYVFTCEETGMTADEFEAAFNANDWTWDRSYEAIERSLSADRHSDALLETKLYGLRARKNHSIEEARTSDWAATEKGQPHSSGTLILDSPEGLNVTIGDDNVVRIPGGLRHSDGPISFARWSFFQYDDGDKEEVFNEGLFTYRIIHPVEQLTINLILPPSTTAVVEAAALRQVGMDSENMICAPSCKRFNFSRYGNSSKLVIHKPLPMLSFGLRWRPRTNQEIRS